MVYFSENWLVFFLFSVHFFLECIQDKGKRMTRRGKVEGEGEEKREEE